MKFRYVILVVIALVVLGAVEGFFIHKYFFGEAQSEVVTQCSRANVMGELKASNLEEYGDRVVYWEDEVYCGDFCFEIVLASIPWKEGLQKGFAVYNHVLEGEDKLEVFELAPLDSDSLSYELWFWEGKARVDINGETFYTYMNESLTPSVRKVSSSVELYEY